MATMRSCFLAMAAFLALVPSPGIAAAMDCTRKNVALTITPLLGGSSVNNQHRQGSMQELSGIGDSVHHGTTPLALGLTLTRVISTSRISAYLQDNFLGNSSCGALTALAIEFGFEPHTIYIPAEFTPQSCAYNAIYAHEAKHVAMDRIVLQENLPLIRERIGLAVAAIPPAQGQDTVAVQKELKAQVEKVIDAEMRAFSIARERAQSRVDSVEEYAMVSQSCGGIIRQILRR